MAAEDPLKSPYDVGVHHSETSSALLLDAYAAQRCPVRLQNSLDDSLEVGERRSRSDAEQRRIDAGIAHEHGVIDKLVASLESSIEVIGSTERAASQAATADAIERRVPVIARGWLAPDRIGHRSGRPDLLVLCDDGYLPVGIKLHLLTNPGGRSLESSPLAAPFPAASSTVPGRRFRRGAAWLNDSLQLAHYHRMLDARGVAARSDGLLGGIIDGSGELWWISGEAGTPGGGVLADYDQRFADRLAVAKHAIARNADPSLERMVDPWWHKECESCLFEATCRSELEGADDASLVHWSSTVTLARLREAGVKTRRDLANLDLGATDLAERLADTTLPLSDLLTLCRAAEPESPISEVVGARMGVRRRLEAAGITTPADVLDRDSVSLELSSSISDLGRLVRRARAAVAGGTLRSVSAEQLDARRGDVEVDVDMESYGSATYLWGAMVTSRVPLEGVDDGYRSFVTFDDLDDAAEALIFGDFWTWLIELRTRVRAQGHRFRAYCFWRAAEEGQMRRAVSFGGDGLPSARTLERFFASDEWVDLHELARDQLVTEGPLGLKVLAARSGFSWRDDDPSGEASIGWYEEARLPSGHESRARLLAYNEDDVRATRALRSWLDGDARLLPHVDDIRGDQ